MGRPTAATDGQTVRLPPALMRPIAAGDMAAALADAAPAGPLNGPVELAGPAPTRLDALVRQFLTAASGAAAVPTRNGRVVGRAATECPSPH